MTEREAEEECCLQHVKWKWPEHCLLQYQSTIFLALKCWVYFETLSFGIPQHLSNF